QRPERGERGERRPRGERQERPPVEAVAALPAVAPLSEDLAAVHDAPPTFVDSQAEAALPPTGDTPAGEERQGRGRRRRRGGRDREDSSGTAGAEAAEGTVDAAAQTPAEAPADGVPPVESDDAGEGHGRENRRRGGRNRNRNRREEGAVEGQDTLANDETAAAEQAAPAAPVQSSLIEDAMAAAPAPAPAPMVAAPAPVPAPAPVVEAFKLPMNELQAIAEGAGLQWVNSDADKIAAAQAAIAAEPTPAALGREPAPVVVVDEGPLVLVETRKDLSQVKLPFEA
ncbi:MAG TPA: ribonuclease E/G, partial [Roseateles sp.]